MYGPNTQRINKRKNWNFIFVYIFRRLGSSDNIWETHNVTQRMIAYLTYCRTYNMNCLLED